MATFLAKIKVTPGSEQKLEAMAASLYEATHRLESHVRRYEYWRGQAERTYYTLLSFDDYVGFLEHQASEHHEVGTADFRTFIESFEIEWVDPIQGASPLEPTNSMEVPPDATDLMKAYAERMPAEVAAWWLPLR
jgi:hypothetical protein